MIEQTILFTKHIKDQARQHGYLTIKQQTPEQSLEDFLRIVESE